MILTTNLKSQGKKHVIAASILMLMHTTASANEQTLSAFDKAMQHVELGQWQQAQTLLDYKLELKPAHHRARLELAMVQMQLGQYEQADANLTHLLSVDELPEGVRFNIELMQQQIAAMTSEKTTSETDRHQWAFTVGLAAGYDSNVRFSFGDYFLEDDPYTDGSLVSLGDGTIVFYAPDGNIYTENGEIIDAEEIGIDFGPREQDTTYIEAKMRVEHSAHFNQLSWHNQLLIQSSDNKEFSDFDKALYQLQSELSWQLAENSEIYTKYKHRTLSRGGDTLLTSNDITLGYSRLSHYGNFDIYSQWMQRDFSDRETLRGNVSSFFEGFDNDTHTIGVSWSKFLLNQRLLTKVSLEYKDNKASDDFNYKGFSTKLTGIYKLTDKWNLAAYYSYFNQDYGNEYSNDSEPLIDKSYKFGIKLDYQLTPNREIYLGFDRGFRDSDVYGNISSQKSNVKLGINVTF